METFDYEDIADLLDGELEADPDSLAGIGGFQVNLILLDKDALDADGLAEEYPAKGTPQYAAKYAEMLEANRSSIRFKMGTLSAFEDADGDKVLPLP